MGELGGLGLEELAPCRRAEEQLAHLDAGALAAGSRLQLAFQQALQVFQAFGLVLGLAQRLEETVVRKHNSLSHGREGHGEDDHRTKHAADNEGTAAPVECLDALDEERCVTFYVVPHSESRRGTRLY